MTLSEVWLLTRLLVYNKLQTLRRRLCYPRRDTASMENRPQNGENTSVREIVWKSLRKPMMLTNEEFLALIFRTYDSYKM